MAERLYHTQSAPAEYEYSLFTGHPSQGVAHTVFYSTPQRSSSSPARLRGPEVHQPATSLSSQSVGTGETTESPPSAMPENGQATPSPSSSQDAPIESPSPPSLVPSEQSDSEQAPARPPNPVLSECPECGQLLPEHFLECPRRPLSRPPSLDEIVPAHADSETDSSTAPSTNDNQNVSEEPADPSRELEEIFRRGTIRLRRTLRHGHAPSPKLARADGILATDSSRSVPQIADLADFSPQPDVLSAREANLRAIFERPSEPRYREVLADPPTSEPASPLGHRYSFEVSADDRDPLFVPPPVDQGGDDQEGIDGLSDDFLPPAPSVDQDEEEELNRAILMSLEAENAQNYPPETQPSVVDDGGDRKNPTEFTPTSGPGTTPGHSTQPSTATNTGTTPGHSTQHSTATNIGTTPGHSTQHSTATNIGTIPGQATQPSTATNIGTIPGQATQPSTATNIGTTPGHSTQPSTATNIGTTPGHSTQPSTATNVGTTPGHSTQPSSATNTSFDYSLQSPFSALASATDNPVILECGCARSGGRHPIRRYCPQHDPSDQMTLTSDPDDDAPPVFPSQPFASQGMEAIQPTPPTQPYGMHAQNTFAEDDADIVAGLAPSNGAGIPGSYQNHQSRLGPDAEDADDLTGLHPAIDHPQAQASRHRPTRRRPRRDPLPSSEPEMYLDNIELQDLSQSPPPPSAPPSPPPGFDEATRGMYRTDTNPYGASLAAVARARSEAERRELFFSQPDITHNPERSPPPPFREAIRQSNPPRYLAMGQGDGFIEGESSEQVSRRHARQERSDHGLVLMDCERYCAESKYCCGFCGYLLNNVLDTFRCCFMCA